jgi:hypothetical protein
VVTTEGAIEMARLGGTDYGMDEFEKLKFAVTDPEDQYHHTFFHEGDDDFEIIDEESNGSGRWSEYMTTYLKGPSGQHYAIDWNSGLTEYQENSYDDPRVRKVKPVTKQVTITEWVTDELAA